MTAYELRISDWSSDVCASDLMEPVESRPVRIGVEEGRQRREVGLRVASAEIQPSDDLVGEGMRALLRQGQAALGMAVLQQRHRRGVALAIGFGQTFRPSGSGE